jgi:lipoate-protein ligase A
MKFLSLTLPTLEENLALDEVLLLEAEDGPSAEVLRIWEWPTPAVVLGAAGILDEDVIEDACRADGVPIGRRSSGGGTVLLGPGCLLYSLVLAFDTADDLTRIGCSYCYILGKIRDALAPAIDGIDLAGTSDLAIAGRKFSGNAQQRKRRHVLHHGSILYDFDLDRVGKYLHPPKRQPDYRQNRDHRSFLMNLPLRRDTIVAGLRRVWQADEETCAWPAGRVETLVREKYLDDDWVRRR